MYSNEQLDTLRDKVRVQLSEKRFSHVLGVENRCAQITKNFSPEHVNIMRAAGLLHDITKEHNEEKQLLIIQKFDIIDRISTKNSPEVLHQMTTVPVINEHFPEFAHEIILNCVRWHTTGHVSYDLFGKILYLSDYIEETRTYPECKMAREFFDKEILECKTYAQKINVLNRACMLKLDYLFNYYVRVGKVINVESCFFRNKLIEDIEA